MWNWVLQILKLPAKFGLFWHIRPPGKVPSLEPVLTWLERNVVCWAPGVMLVAKGRAELFSCSEHLNVGM